MNDFFVWLFNEYVVPQVEEDSFPHEYQVEKRRWMEAIERMSQDDRLQSLDIMGNGACKKGVGCAGLCHGHPFGNRIRGGFQGDRRRSL